MDFHKRYNEESHLFDVINPRFHAQGWLDAYDLFFIVRWKSNRAISKVANRLRSIGGTDLQQVARKLTGDVHAAKTPEERFNIVGGHWKLRLPMASAILTVLYPDDFTVYDVRVCDMISAFHTLGNRTNVGARWQGYREFCDAVTTAAPAHLSLREKDRWLWAKSRHQDLMHFLVHT